MSYCVFCGKKLPEGTEKCPVCFPQPKPAAPPPPSPPPPPVPEIKPRRTAEETSVQKQDPSYGAEPLPKPGLSRNGSPEDPNRKVIMENIYLAEGECLVRRYRCCETKRPSGKGTLFLTNKRVIFCGEGEKNQTLIEMPVKSVAGISSYIGWHCNVLGILLGILIGILGLWLFGKLTNGGGFIIAMVVLSIGIVLVATSIRQRFFLYIYSAKAVSAPIALGSAQAILKNSATFSLNSVPSYATKDMLNEMGAIVTDLQSMGDRALERWGTKKI